MACGVFILLKSGICWESTQKLLQEGDYTVEAKAQNKAAGTISGVYWLLVTAGYLAWSFWSGEWNRTWIIWPVAGVLFVAVIGIAAMFRKK